MTKIKCFYSLTIFYKNGNIGELACIGEDVAKETELRIRKAINVRGVRTSKVSEQEFDRIINSEKTSS